MISGFPEDVYPGGLLHLKQEKEDGQDGVVG